MKKLLRRGLSSAPYDTRVFAKASACSPVDRVKGDINNLYERANTIIARLLKEANLTPKDVSLVVVGNMMSPVLQHQNQIASAVCSRAPGFLGKDSFSVDAASGSGAAAFRLGTMAVRSKMHKHVIALGLEQMLQTSEDNTGNKTSEELTIGLAQASDWATQGSKGATFMSLNDDLMSEYIRRYGDIVDAEDFFYFSENSHRNAIHNENAVFRKEILIEQYKNSPKLGKSVSVLDSCPTSNGCAGVLLSADGSLGQTPFVAASESCIDDIVLSNRPDLLHFRALEQSIESCLQQAQISRDQIDLYEVHDAYSIMSVLCLEVGGFVPKGQGLEFAKSGEISLRGQLPISTFGGLKARGHPVGASGMYQICEAIEQLKGTAGKNQVKISGQNFPKFALASSFGGAATTVISHILSI